MKFMIHCRNDKCKFYYEDGCFNDEVKTIVLDENGICETFEKGEHVGYKIDIDKIDKEDIEI